MNKRDVDVNESLIIECLKEIADIEYQQRVWIEGKDDEISSFSDVIAALFDDSLLEDALIKNKVIFSNGIDDMLRELDNKIKKLPSDIASVELIMLPQWKEIGILSKNIVEELRLKGLE